MSTVEERLRAALQAHAEDFQARPDAWPRLQARRRSAARRRRLAPRVSWPARFMIPAAAAAAVVAVVVAAALVVNGVPGRAGPAEAARSRPATAPSATPGSMFGRALGVPGSGPSAMMLTMDPPSSAVIGMWVPWIGKKADRVAAYFWVGRDNPRYWLDRIDPGQVFCHDVVNSAGESSGFCWPLPRLGPGHVAAVTGSEGVGTDQTIMVGAAGAQVASVTAVLSDGRAYPGVVETGRGLTDKAWTVGYPWTNGFSYTKGAHLVFRDASGHVLSTLSPSAPLGPGQLAQPAQGGVRVYSYAASDGEPAGHVDAYLIQGRVGFWSQIWGGTISPVPATDSGLGGLIEPFGLQPGGSWAVLTAFGYTYTSVTRVVLRGPGGRKSSASMIPVSWPGLRLWVADVPAGGRAIRNASVTVTVTGYDAAGHVVSQVRLGQME